MLRPHVANPARRGGQGLTLVFCVLAASCVGATRVIPQALATPGVQIEKVGFSHELVAEFSGGPGTNRVMYLDRQGLDALMIVTERGIRWLDDRGTTVRAVSFAERTFRPSPVRNQSSMGYLVGLAGKDHAVVLDLEGRSLHRFKAGAGYNWPIAANVVGDAAPEIILRKRTGADIRSLAGTSVASVEWGRYTTFVEVMQADDDEPLELVLFNTHLGSSEIEVRVANADGSVVRDWATPKGNWLSLVPAQGMDRVWAAVDDELIAYSATGEIVDRLEAPGAGYLRYVTGAKLNDTSIMVVSGGGYRSQSVLLVYDADRRLVYQETVEDHSYALSAHPGRPTTFYLGSGERVYRYARSEPKGAAQ